MLLDKKKLRLSIYTNKPPSNTCPVIKYLKVFSNRTRIQNKSGDYNISLNIRNFIHLTSTKCPTDCINIIQVIELNNTLTKRLLIFKHKLFSCSFILIYTKNLPQIYLVNTLNHFKHFNHITPEFPTSERKHNHSFRSFLV